MFTGSSSSLTNQGKYGCKDYLRGNKLITVNSLNKEPQITEVLTEGKENMEWAMEEEVRNNNYGFTTSYQIEDI